MIAHIDMVPIIFHFAFFRWHSILRFTTHIWYGSDHM